jgi:hypothetical protein
VGEVLGIDIECGDKSEAIGIVANEIRPVYPHPAAIVIGGWIFETRVGFMGDLARQGWGLVGQNGFFDLFSKVSFNRGKEVVEFTPHA